ncbi:MAG: N-acetyltransferase [Acidimicrobiia bacterium]|nr:N-acetyltransferase [Acidimicrobiia bacterium]
MNEALPDGWGASSPRHDTLTRDYAEGYGDLLEALGQANGASTSRTEEFVAFDSHVSFPFMNCAVPLRPIVDAADPLLDEITAFFAPDNDDTPFLLYALTPVPSLADRGWTLMGHPPLMLRPAGPADVPEPAGLQIVEVTTPDLLAAFDTTMVEAYPVPELQGRRTFGDGLLGIENWHMWVGQVDGETVGTAAGWVTDAHVDVEWISTMPSARGKRVGEALTWAATLVAPDKPAMLIASDLGQPVYERMGYLRLSRLTLWIGRRDSARK